MAQRTRLSRKDIKRPDEFLVLSRQAFSWAQGHQRWLVWAAVAVVGLLFLFGVTSAYRHAQQRDANADLSRAMAKLSDPDTSGATLELREVANRWHGTEVGAVAALLAANNALRTGQPDDVLSLAPSIPEDELPPYLRQQRLLLWAAALEAKEQWLEAAAKYQEAAAMSGPYAGPATLGEARTRELGGEADRSRELYRRAYEQFPELPSRDLLAQKFQS
ncbi:MAG: hypothetical protein AB7V27_13245 [Candidatus Binatia bacterium]